MGYCCFCIPLTACGLVIACLDILSSLYDFIDICLNSVPEDDFALVMMEFSFDIAMIITAVFLLVGIIRRRYEYFLPYLILRATAICLLCIATFVVLLVWPVMFALLWAALVLSCLFVFPIYLLFVEIRNENIIGINV